MSSFAINPGQDIPADSGIAGLTTENLVALTLRQAWQLCGEDQDLFGGLIGQVAVNLARYRGLALPDGPQRGRVISAISLLLVNECDQFSPSWSTKRWWLQAIYGLFFGDE